MALKEVAAVFGIKVDDEQLKRADKGISNFIDKLGEVGRALVGGVAAIGFFHFVKSLADTGDALNDASNRLGVGTDALQELSYAASQSGAGLENLTTGLLILNDKVGDALVNATGEGAKAFQKYGIAIKGAGGEVKASDELFSDIADRIGRAKTAQEQLTIAVDFFGKQGRTLLPLLKEGGAGLEAMRKRARGLGEGFSKEAVVASDAFNDSLADMGRVIQTVRGRIAVALLPLLKRFVDGLVAISARLLDFAKNSALVEGVLLAISGILVAKLIPSFVSLIRTLAPLAVPLAVFVGIALAIDEIITLMRGGKTVIGDFLDKLYGEGTAKNFPWDVRNVLKETIEYFERLIVAAQAAFKVMRGEKLTANDIKTFGQLVQPFVGDNAVRSSTDQEAQRVRIREQAARAGQTVRFPGDPGYGTGNMRGLSAPVAGPTGPSIDARSNVTVQVAGNATPETVTQLEQVMSDLLDRRADEVRAALVTAVPR
jgi:hypothetical protein